MRFKTPSAPTSKLDTLIERTRQDLLTVEGDLRGDARSPILAYSLRVVRARSRALSRFSILQPEIAPAVRALNAHVVDLCQSLTDERGRTLGGLKLRSLNVQTLLSLTGAHDALGRLQGTHVTVRR